MELHYKVFGQGKPLIILHGLFGMLDNWQTIARKLADDFTVFIIDQRNHGKSGRADKITYPLMANDLEQFMDKNWIQEAMIMGHSMGGKTAMQFASLYPDRVDKLVVVDIAPKKYPNRHQKIFDALLSVPIEQINSRTEAADILGQKIQSESIRQFLMKNISRNKNGSYEWKMNLEVIYNNYDHILESVNFEHLYNGPTLFIKGGNSNYIMDDDTDFIQKTFAQSFINTIPNAGHWVHAEQTAAFLKTLQEFLKK